MQLIYLLPTTFTYSAHRKKNFQKKFKIISVALGAQAMPHKISNLASRRCTGKQASQIVDCLTLHKNISSFEVAMAYLTAKISKRTIRRGIIALIFEDATYTRLFIALDEHEPLVYRTLSDCIWHQNLNKMILVRYISFTIRFLKETGQ